MMPISPRARPATVSLLALALVLAGCGGDRHPEPLPAAGAAETFVGEKDPGNVGVTVIGGEAPVPAARPGAPLPQGKPGDIRLNFPGADVRVVAKAVLGDLLHVPYTVAPGVANQITLVTPGGIARDSVLSAFENALRSAGLALVQQNGGFAILTIENARALGVTGATSQGYSSEIIRLQFINAEELKKLLDSVVPGVVAAFDKDANAVTIAGTAGQRASAHDLIAQFDVNWLRSMSFAYYIPQRTDARLIVPELEKLINAPDAPTRGLVRLIAMEHLNGIIAVSAQKQYLEDVRRWIDVLDREGTNNEPKLFVYRVQNGRSRDLAKTLNAAFGRTDNSANGSAADPFASNTTNNSPGANGGTGGASGNGPARPLDSQNLGGSGGPNGTSGGFGGANGNAGPGRGPQVSITSDETNNAVIVFGSPREYAVVEDALRKLDVPPYQVLIEAAITEVSLNDNLKYGLQWNFTQGTSSFSQSDGTTATPVRSFPGFSYMLNTSDINAVLNALEQRTTLKVVSAPKLVVLNNQTAALQVGDQVPIQTQSSQSTVTGSAPVINSIEYRDTGVIFKVTPRVNAGGLVLLDIAQEVSDVSNRTISGISSPIISTRRIATTIAVQDGQVVTLGGLFRDSDTWQRNGLPLLSRIPVVGGLFGNHDKTKARTELLVLIKPHVLRSADDAREVTEDLRAKIRTLEPFKTKGKIP